MKNFYWDEEKIIVSISQVKSSTKDSAAIFNQRIKFDKQKRTLLRRVIKYYVAMRNSANFKCMNVLQSINLSSVEVQATLKGLLLFKNYYSASDRISSILYFKNGWLHSTKEITSNFVMASKSNHEWICLWKFYRFSRFSNISTYCIHTLQLSKAF